MTDITYITRGTLCTKVYAAVRKGLMASLLEHFFAATQRPFEIVHSVDQLSPEQDGAHATIVLVDIALDFARSHERLLTSVRERTNAPAVALCRVRDRRHIEQILASGFAGVVAEDDCTAESLARTLDLISKGETIMPAAFFKSSGPTSDDRLERLTETERRILTMIMEGRLNKEIAATIGRSEIAVKMQVRSLCEKLRARNRTEAAMIGLQLLEG